MKKILSRPGLSTAYKGVVCIVLMIGIIQANFRLIAQEPQFSQFYAAPLYLAPSFAGATDGSRLGLNYRNQWPSIPGAFVTYAFSLDHYFHNFNSGVGLLVLRDQAGTGRLANTSMNLMYSYNFQVNHNLTLRPGVAFSVAERTLDFFRLTFGDQLDLGGQHRPTTVNPVVPIERVRYFDAAASVVAHSNTIWAGLTVDNLMRPNRSMLDGQVNRIPMKFSVFAGYRYEYGGFLRGDADESISLALLYRNQGKFNQLDVGLYWSKHPISLGLLYRGIPIFNNYEHGLFNNDAIVAIAGIRTRFLRLGYSYDMTISRLINTTGGSHEISLIYHFNQGPPNRTPRMLPCPD
ncbi:MAG TPA: type IX secretion system membrane protein PorP/SprF [Bacteroidales bacterium]|nr:type IX secretion system membrane protein PorP/SprF [Bacteroidales bacterium]